MRIQREKSVGMIEDNDLTIPFQPVGKHHDAGHDGSNRTAFVRPNFDALSLNIGVKGRVFLTSEKGENLSIGRPMQGPFERMASLYISWRLKRGCFTPLLQLL